jgi:hypothetical protein
MCQTPTKIKRGKISIGRNVSDPYKNQRGRISIGHNVSEPYRSQGGGGRFPSDILCHTLKKIQGEEIFIERVMSDPYESQGLKSSIGQKSTEKGFQACFEVLLSEPFFYQDTENSRKPQGIINHWTRFERHFSTRTDLLLYH